MQEPIYKALARELGVKHAEPSSGYVAVRMVQYCNTKRAKVHVYGMNWSPKNWDGHNVRPLPVRKKKAMYPIVHCHRLASNPRGNVRQSDASCHGEPIAHIADQGICNA